MLKLKIYRVLLVVAVFIIGISLLVYLNKSATTPADSSTTVPVTPSNQFTQKINNFEECVAATNLVFTSSPSKCVSPDGRIFVDPLANQVEVITEVEKLK